MEDGDVFYFVEKGKFGTCKKGVLEYDENSVNVNEGSTSDFYSADVTCQSNEKLVVKLVVKKKSNIIGSCYKLVTDFNI